MNAYNAWIQEHIQNRLQDYEGGEYYACDLASELTMAENYDGCAIMWTNEALQFIADNWQYASDVFDHYALNLDMKINPFENPCSYTFFMLDYGVSSVLAQCAYIDEHWNEEITLTPETIETITAQAAEITL